MSGVKVCVSPNPRTKRCEPDFCSGSKPRTSGDRHAVDLRGWEVVGHAADNRGVPAGNTGQEQTKTSMEKIAGVLAKEKAALWINHDKAQRDSLKMSPAFYE